MKQIILTKKENTTLGMLTEPWGSEEGVPVELKIFQQEHPSLIGEIVVGHIRDIVKNIDAAFVEIAPDTIGYLSLKHALIQPLNRQNPAKLCKGDRILVQVAKDAIKTKDAVLTTQFSLTGRYLVLTHGREGITFSSKIKDQKLKDICRQAFESSLSEEHFGLLFRTESTKVPIDTLMGEMEKIVLEYHDILKTAETRPKYHVLKEAPSRCTNFLLDVVKDGSDCRILTDQKDLFSMYETMFSSYPAVSVQYYEDPLLSLDKLYRFEKAFSEAYAKKVWLRSGAYLIIEYTEAMTVIDVNTGKCEKGKDPEELFFRINKEAALEIARQLRLRNLSGIILIDFIDMTLEVHTEALLRYMREVTSYDPVKTSVVDITKLHLMELTRKKTTDRLPYLSEYS